MARGVIVTICVGLGFALTVVAVSPVSLKLYGGKNNWIHVNFYEDDFFKFYTCMRTSYSLSCTADLTRDIKHPNETDDLRILSVNKPEILRTSRAYSNVFACNASFSEKQLVCKRQLANYNLCLNHVEIEYFHFLNDSTKSRCVGLRFSFSNESLLYDPISYGIEICNISCNSSVANPRGSPSSHLSLPSSQDVWTTSTENVPLSNTTDNQKNHTKEPSHHQKDDDDDDDDHHHEHHDGDKTHIIIAAVVSVVVTSGLIISAILFRRQILRMRKQHDTRAEYASRTPTTEYTNNTINNHNGTVPAEYVWRTPTTEHTNNTTNNHNGTVPGEYVSRTPTTEHTNNTTNNLNGTVPAEYVSRTPTTEHTNNTTNNHNRTFQAAHEHSSTSADHSLSTV